jgi:predicted O-methyltransferase YrrM
MSKDFFFPDDGSEEWLLPADARIAVHLLRRTGVGEGPRVLEIGVWKGAWTSVVLRNVPGASVVGVDPYPGGAGSVREGMLRRLDSLSVSERFSLHSDVSDLDPSSRFDLIHVDGDHSEDAVWEDLRRAEELLAPTGVIIVDDISHKWLPGVASATYRYCAGSDLRMFLLTNAKGYLARRATADALHRSLSQDRRSIAGVRLFRDYQEMTGHPYPETSELLGQSVLLARGDRKTPTSAPAQSAFRTAISLGVARLRRVVRRISGRA